jgi:hypothetical protein
LGTPGVVQKLALSISENTNAFSALDVMLTRCFPAATAAAFAEGQVTGPQTAR